MPVCLFERGLFLFVWLGLTGAVLHAGLFVVAIWLGLTDAVLHAGLLVRCSAQASPNS